SQEADEAGRSIGGDVPGLDAFDRAVPHPSSDHGLFHAVLTKPPLVRYPLDPHVDEGTTEHVVIRQRVPGCGPWPVVEGGRPACLGSGKARQRRPTPTPARPRPRPDSVSPQPEPVPDRPGPTSPR